MHKQISQVIKVMSCQRVMRCPACDGSGQESVADIIRYETCGGCAGTGRDKTSDLWSEPCLTCNGSGKVQVYKSYPCKKCNGNKVIYY